MSLPSQTAQKTKPLFIAIGIIAFAILVISQAPGFVQMVSSMWH